MCHCPRGAGRARGSLIWKAAEHPCEYLLHPSRACTQEPCSTSARGQSLPVCLASRKHIVQKCVLLGIGGRCRSLLSRASTSILRASQVGIAHGPMGDREHPRASCALHRQEPLMCAWVSMSTREHPVRCTGKNRSWAHWRSRAHASIHDHPARCTGGNRSWPHMRAPHPRAACPSHR